MHDTTLSLAPAGSLKLRSLKDGVEFPLDADEMLVGREVECSISLNSGHISRYHAKLSLVGGDVVVEDLRSTNGTFVNGRRITTPQSLSLGDEVRFHEMSFRLVSDEDGSGAAEATVIQQQPLMQEVVSPQSRTVEQPANFIPPRNQQQPASQLHSQAAASPEARKAPQSRAPAPEPDVAEEESTRLLNMEALNRLQGKSEHTNARVDNGSGPRLVMLTAPTRGKVYSLISRNKNAWVIGRDRDVDFQVSDKTVSGQHARIRKLSDEWVLESCEGRNPIFINNRSVEFTTLHPGDVIRVGRMELIFRVDEKTLVPEFAQKPTFTLSRTNILLLTLALVVLGVVLGIVLV